MLPESPTKNSELNDGSIALFHRLGFFATIPKYSTKYKESPAPVADNLCNNYTKKIQIDRPNIKKSTINRSIVPLNKAINYQQTFAQEKSANLEEIGIVTTRCPEIIIS